MEGIDADRLTKIYRKIREAREAATSAYKRQDEEYKDQLDTVAKLLIDLLDVSGAMSMRTEHGTVTKVIKQKFWSSDWDEFKSFCKENDALDLFEHRIAQKNMAEWVARNPEKIPAGLQMDRSYNVLVVKPRTSHE